MEYSVELLKIIEGCVKLDKNKVVNYTELLIKKLNNDGEKKFANRLSKVLMSCNTNTLNVTEINTSYKIPLDNESRLPIADLTLPKEIDESAVYLNKSCKEQIDLFFEYYRNKNLIITKGIDLPNTLIFFGPPGCGKTKLAHYLAKRVELPLITTRLDGLISSYLGSTAKNIRSIFEYAQNVPCVLFLDEFDAIAKVRDDTNELGELKRIVNSLLQNIDSLKNGSIIVAATNHEQLLDPAVWRRFMFKINILKPELDVRVKLVSHFLQDFKIDEKDIYILAYMFKDLTGAEIEQICDKAKMDTIVYKQNLKLNTFVKHFFNFRPIEMLDNDSEKDVMKKQMQYLREINDKTFSYTKLAEIYGVSKSFVSQLFKEE